MTANEFFKKSLNNLLEIGIILLISKHLSKPIPVYLVTRVF